MEKGSMYLYYLNNVILSSSINELGLDEFIGSTYLRNNMMTMRGNLKIIDHEDI